MISTKICTLNKINLLIEIKINILLSNKLYLFVNFFYIYLQLVAKLTAF